MEQEVVERGGHLFGMSFGTFLLDMLFIFFFVIWFWILIRVMMDLFRREDISGGAKVLWVIFLVVLPYIGIFAYLLTQGWSMGERDVEQADGGARAAPQRRRLQRRRRARPSSTSSRPRARSPRRSTRSCGRS